jgi:6-pyruvoyltetrahydropterin/6-carboxytetrahydropterin synthase
MVSWVKDQVKPENENWGNSGRSGNLAPVPPPLLKINLRPAWLGIRVPSSGVSLFHCRDLSMHRVTREIHFCYGHRLLNYQGKCRHLHGHNGKALITIENERLDPLGMVVDFSEIKRIMQTWIDEKLDHKMLLHRDDPILPALQALREPLFLMEVNPTAENIAKLIYEETKRHGFPVVEVSLWETPNSYATYRE